MPAALTSGRFSVAECAALRRWMLDALCGRAGWGSAPAASPASWNAMLRGETAALLLRARLG
ncbi:MAG TPA: hypothetical protein VHG08_29375, partial [Longimicrobium sp.]|nr:hypothetical protein [Longimicrobium sp.]